jgi:hypothetical protein
MFEHPVDLLERNKLWVWSDPVDHGVCALCNRERDIMSLRTRACGACHTLGRCYDPASKQLRLQGHVIFVTENRAIVWQNPPAQPKSVVVFAPQVEVVHATPESSYLRDAFTFIADEKNRSEDFLFMNFYSKKIMSVNDLVINMDPDVLMISALRARPKDSLRRFRNVINMDVVKSLSNVNFGRMADRDKARLIESGYTAEDFDTSDWKFAHVISGEGPKSWF